MKYLTAVGKDLRHCLFCAVFVEGKELGSGGPIKALYIGNSLNHRFVFNSILSEYIVLDIKKNLHIFKAFRFAQEYENKLDIIFMDLGYIYGKLMKLYQMNYIYVPRFLGQKMDIGKNKQDLVNYLRRHRDSKIINRIIKNNITYRIVATEDEYRDFYHNYYMPYTRKRFGETALIENEEVFLRMCRRGKVMQILHDNEVKLYCLMQLESRVLSLHWLGISENINEKMHSIIINASYYYQFLYAFENGCDYVDLLYVRPLLNDGVYLYKRCWGAKIYPVSDLKGGIYIKPTNMSGPIVNIFSNNYYVTKQNKKLIAKIMINNADLSVEYLDKFMKNHYSKGIDAVRIYSLRKVDPAVTTWAQEHLSPLQVIDLSDEKNPQESFCM